MYCAVRRMERTGRTRLAPCADYRIWRDNGFVSRTLGTTVNALNAVCSMQEPELRVPRIPSFQYSAPLRSWAEELSAIPAQCAHDGGEQWIDLSQVCAYVIKFIKRDEL